MNKPMNFNPKPPISLHITQRPWQKLFVDFLGPYPRSKSGNCYILIVIDQVSRFVLLKALRNATAEALVKYLENDVFMVYGTPEFMLSDNSRQFGSKILKNLLMKYGVIHEHTPKYHPQPNASERVNLSILSAIRAYVHGEHTSWDVHLSENGQALRNVIHNSSLFSPQFVVFGHHQILHSSLYAVLRKLYNLT